MSKLTGVVYDYGDIQVTLTERPGLPVSIIVNRDLVLRPYQPMFFNRGTSQ